MFVREICFHFDFIDGVRPLTTWKKGKKERSTGQGISIVVKLNNNKHPGCRNQKDNFHRSCYELWNSQVVWLIWGGDDRNWAISKKKSNNVSLHTRTQTSSERARFHLNCCAVCCATSAYSQIRAATNEARNTLMFVFIEFAVPTDPHQELKTLCGKNGYWFSFFACFVKYQHNNALINSRFSVKKNISILNIINVYDYYIIKMKISFYVVAFAFVFVFFFSFLVLVLVCIPWIICSVYWMR